MGGETGRGREPVITKYFAIQPVLEFVSYKSASYRMLSQITQAARWRKPYHLLIAPNSQLTLGTRAKMGPSPFPDIAVEFAVVMTNSLRSER